MVQQLYREPDIYRIDVPLPENPLRNLNCYVIRDGAETLLLDTGFNRAECRDALLAGLAELGVDPTRMDLFLTHLHSDHTGLAPTLMAGSKGKIYISGIDHDILRAHLQGDYWVKSDEIFAKEGFTEAQLTELHRSNPARGLEPTGFFEAERMQDGDEIRVGRWTFRCIWVAGHTPGQMCLYCAEKEILFTADHILFDITPNITAWRGVADSLGDYLNSLVKIRSIPIQTAFPAHRKNDMDVYERIAQIIEHHLARLLETADALAAHPDADATQVASCLKWSMRGKSWAEFPLSQRWFAVGETMAHLDYLRCRGLAVRTEGEHRAYRLTVDVAECKKRLEEAWRAYR